MKKFKQLVMAFLVGVVSFGFTACDDSNNDVEFELPEVGQATVNVSSSDKEMQKVAKVYVNQVVYPTFLQAVAADVRNITALLEFTWMGSAITYARRYALTAMLGIITEEDDDGEAAKMQPKTSGRVKQPINGAQVQKGFQDRRTQANKNSGTSKRQYGPFADLPQLDGVSYQIVNAQDGRECIVATGDTQTRSEILSGAGFRWNAQRKFWWKYAGTA